MNIVLLSGGSGKRLWPLSNDIRSKQFIKIFKNENGEYESMLQRVYRQIKKADPRATVTIATSQSQVPTINNQLGKGAAISVEPCRRDTFPAIALASAYLCYVLRVPLDEAVVFCPVDPYVDDSYFEALKKMAAQAERGEANIVLMGIEPSSPSSKFGYIIPESSEQTSRVRAFKEKPDEETARRYIADGALWNGGVFAFKLRYIVEKAHELINFIDYDDLYVGYDRLPKLSFDYAVVEDEPSIQVMRYSGEWKDLGTWNSLTEAIGADVVGDGIMSDDCTNVHIVNEMDVPILAMGMHDVVISASSDGILVSDIDKASQIKKYVDDIHQEARFAETSFGSYRTLDVEQESQTVKISLEEGHSIRYQNHRHRDEVMVILEGSGTSIVDEMSQKIKAGDVITIAAGCKHMIIAETNMKLIEIQLGKWITDKDRIYFDRK